MIHSKWNFKKAVLVAGAIIGATALFSFATMFLWNWIVPDLFGLRSITFWQALGLLLLCRLLFGWKSHSHYSSHSHLMKERWSKMTPEERKKFSHKMHNFHSAHSEWNNSEEKQHNESSTEQ